MSDPQGREHDRLEAEMNAAPHTTPRRNVFPQLIGNALILADGSARQVRVLDRLYYRCGIVTLDALVEAYQ